MPTQYVITTQYVIISILGYIEVFYVEAFHKAFVAFAGPIIAFHNCFQYFSEKRVFHSLYCSLGYFLKENVSKTSLQPLLGVFNVIFLIRPYYGPYFRFFRMFFLSMCVNGPIVAFGKDICFSSFLFKINGSNSYEWGLFPPN